MIAGLIGRAPRLVAVGLTALLVACDEPGPVAPEAPAPSESSLAAAPAPLVTVGFGGSSLTLWPWIGANLSGAPSDPVNLLFPGRPDPRQLRAALVLLGGDRSAFGFPSSPPFDCTWKDAVGANQATYADGVGWTPSAIQLECGEFNPIRFHIRFFPAGEWTIANAHFEVLIPGTNEHEILTWEGAEQLVTVDFLRSGLLHATQPMSPSTAINDAPSYREIRVPLFNGLPPALRQYLTGSPATASVPVPVATDGRATILNLAGDAGAAPTVAIRDYELQFNQMIPRPFCASGPADFILVQGPIRFRQRVVLTPSGSYVSQFQASGSLDVTPMNPLTSPPTPVGETYRAHVNEHYRNVVTDHVTLVSNLRMQVLIPPTVAGRFSLHASLRIGPEGVEVSGAELRCGS